jgi:hypothetical protein
MDDIKRVAAHYLTDRNRTVITLVPEKPAQMPEEQ